MLQFCRWTNETFPAANQKYVADCDFKKIGTVAYLRPWHLPFTANLGLKGLLEPATFLNSSHAFSVARSCCVDIGGPGWGASYASGCSFPALPTYIGQWVP